ncbi:enoyl-CoA hydratase/isomerase family protein [Mameliella alba]|nr:enoyl-CoA hydratase/isomerase family protein [Mameliella alba]MBY6168731.1 enoyl-CoA hydratase/isomerase family protein [Mameliella alba]MBY6174048.1 enoyl-CoA hydratase/isomerase family protein [Mameliella alba]
MTQDTEGAVRLDINGPLAEIVLDRPAKHNALTPQMYRQIGAACAEANETAAVNVVIFHGAGERAFCAGSDVKALDGYEDFWAWRNRYDYIPPILALRKPAIAAVKGWALGGGLEIALACDLRVVAPSAVFAAPEVQLGWNGAGGAAQQLTRLCGHGQALRYLLTGDRFTAEDAARIGMVEYLVDRGEELTKAREIALKIAGFAPHATQAVKAAVRGAMDLTLEQGLRNENELMSLCFAKAEQARLRAMQPGKEP